RPAPAPEAGPVALVHLFLQLLHRDRGHAHLSLLLFLHPRDTTELLVVDEPRHSGIRAADGAIGVLAHLELAEAHAERVHEEEPSDERFAGSDDELDRLRRLDHAEE